MWSIQAYVLIRVKNGEEGRVIESLRSMENVKEAHSVFGEFDAVAFVQTNTLDKLKETVKA